MNNKISDEVIVIAIIGNDALKKKLIEIARVNKHWTIIGGLKDTFYRNIKFKNNDFKTTIQFKSNRKIFGSSKNYKNKFAENSESSMLKDDEMAILELPDDWKRALDWVLAQ